MVKCKCTLHWQTWSKSTFSWWTLWSISVTLLILRVWQQTSFFLSSSIRILKTLCRKLKLPEDFDYQQLARLTPGYVGADLMALCREAAMSSVNRVLLKKDGWPQSCSQSSTEELLISGGQTEANVTAKDVKEQQITDIIPGPQIDSGQEHLQVWGTTTI